LAGVWKVVGEAIENERPLEKVDEAMLRISRDFSLKSGQLSIEKKENKIFHNFPR
jgi:hypothetical protein